MEITTSSGRFTRTTKPAPLIHYCPKDNMRRYFEVCEKKQCPHFRPYRPPDEGSCACVPRKKEVKEIKKRAEDKKNGNKPVMPEGEFVESGTEGRE